MNDWYPVRLAMRWLLTVTIAAMAIFARADRILLIPLDSRPAAGQFAQMIGKIAGADVVMPAYDDLGRFTSPGKPDRILDWLEHQDMSSVTAVIASADMVAYGGLIASRTPDVPVDLASKRIHRLVDIVNRSKVKLYLSSSTMRLAPTATKENVLWRSKLQKFMALREQMQRTKDESIRPVLHSLLAIIPPKEMKRYELARLRNHQVQKLLIRLAAFGSVDYLVIGQDDAQAYGPHIPETSALKAEMKSRNAEVRVYFSEGIDQHASLLVSRSLLRANDWIPRVRIVYSDPARAEAIADFESKPLRRSLEDQILASGARAADNSMKSDYTLYVNTARPAIDSFNRFMSRLEQDLDRGNPAAIADVNLADDGTADPRLFTALYSNDRMFRTLGYAGWNTAGNTLGTTIPTANVYLLAKRIRFDSVQREIAHKEFLLHRYVDDYAYHKYTRPEAYRMLKNATGVKEESYGPGFDKVNLFVQRDVERYLGTYFHDQFLGRRINTNDQDVVLSGLRDVHIWLPWPRAYEVRLEFKIEAHAILGNR